MIKPIIPKILINSQQSPEFNIDDNSNIINSPSFINKPNPNLRKKPSNLHNKRFSVNLFPVNTKKNLEIDSKKPRKSSLECVLEFDPEKLNKKENFIAKVTKKNKEKEVTPTPIIRKETLRKKAININENLDKTEEKLYLYQYFFENKPKDFVIERHKISRNWLLNFEETDYNSYILNAFHLNIIKFQEFKSIKLQNKEQEQIYQAQIQNLMTKRSILDTNMFLPKHCSNKYNTSISQGILLQKTGSKLPINYYRKVFFSTPYNISLPETENRYSFIQIKGKADKILSIDEKVKEYPLPEWVLFEKKSEKSKFSIDWTASKVKDFTFRVLVWVQLRKNPMGLYIKTEAEAKEIYEYLMFKRFLKGLPQYSKVFQRISMIYYSYVSEKLARLLQEINEKQQKNTAVSKELAESDTSEDSSNEEEIMNLSNSSIGKSRTKDQSLHRKTQQLTLVVKCIKEDLIKWFIEIWLKKACEIQKESFEQTRNLYGLEPRDIMYFETRKKRLKGIESWRKDVNIVGFEKYIMRIFISNWLERVLDRYKKKLGRKRILQENNGKIAILNENQEKTSIFNENHEKKLKINLKRLEIPQKFDYYKPKLQIKLYRKDIERANYIHIDGQRLLVDKNEFYHIIYDTNLIERKIPGLLCYDILMKNTLEIIDFDYRTDAIIFEIFDDACLSIFECFKDPLAIKLPSEIQEKSLDKLDISIFLASSRVITHKTQVFLYEILAKDYWISLDLAVPKPKMQEFENNSNDKNLEVFLNFEIFSEKTDFLVHKIHYWDTIFSSNLSNLELFEPKSIKKLEILNILSISGGLTEEKLISLMHQDDAEVMLKELFLAIIQRNNELICKNYVNSMKNATIWFLKELPELCDENTIKLRSYFLHIFIEIQKKQENTLKIKELTYFGIPIQIRRLLWGFIYREEIFHESVLKYGFFTSGLNINKTMPSPLIEETLYIMFLDENILLLYDKLNYLSYLQDLNNEIHENIDKNAELESFLKKDSNKTSLLNVLKGLYFWSFMNNNRIAMSFPMISIIFKLFLIFQGNFPYYMSNFFDNINLFKRISPNNYLESDVFWVFLTILTRYFPRFYLLEAPMNPLQSSNHYCNSDLRGIKGDILLIKSYVKEEFSCFYEIFNEISMEFFIIPILLDFGIGIFSRRIDIWARLFDRILLEKSEIETNKLILLSIVTALFNIIMVKYKKFTKKIKNIKDLMIFISIEINLCEDIEVFIDNIYKEISNIMSFKQKNKSFISKYEDEIIEYFTYFSKYNKILYNYIEQIKPFNNSKKASSDYKLSLCDVYQILSIENLLKINENKEINRILHIYIHHLIIFYANSFEGELILELIYEENIREIPIQLIIDTRIELNEYVCFKIIENSSELMLKIYQTSSREHKNIKNLLKTCKISLKALNSGILYKNTYKLINQQPDYNFLTSEIGLSLVIEKQQNIENIIKNENFNIDYKKFPMLYSNLDKYQALFVKNNDIINCKAKDFNNLDEKIIAKTSVSCEINYFDIKSNKNIDFLSFSEIFKKITPNSEENNEKCMILYENLKNLPENPLKLLNCIDFSELFIGLILMLPGHFQAKFELFYKLLILLNKGDQSIPLTLFKGFILKMYKFIGFFILDSQINNFIDRMYFGEYQELLESEGIEKAEIYIKYLKFESKKQEEYNKSFDIKGILNDFSKKKLEIYHSKDIILGGSEDLTGLRDIIKFYSEWEIYKDALKPLLDLKNLNNSLKNEEIFFSLEIRYKDNQGLRHEFIRNFDEEWKIMENFNDFSDFSHKKSSFKLHENYFYNHRNTLILSAPCNAIVTKSYIMKIMNILPGFQYMLSLQNLHKIFNKIQDNEISNFPEKTIKITINLEYGLKFHSFLNIDKKGDIFNKNTKLKRLKAKQLALLLDNMNNPDIKSLNDVSHEITINKVNFFEPLEEILLKILIKIMKKLKEISFWGNHDFINIIPLLNLLEKPLNNPLDLQNFSLFTVYFLNKRLRNMSFEASFLRKISRKTEDSIINLSDIKRKTQALGIYRYSDQSFQWLPLDIIHSFLKKEFLRKIPYNFDWENKQNYENFTVIFKKFQQEIFIKKPNELIFLRKHDLRNMQIPIKIEEFLPKFKKHQWKEIMDVKEEKIGESIFKELKKDNLVVARKLTIDERKKVQRKPGKRVLSYLAKNE